MQYPGVPKTLARSDHGAYIEVDFAPTATKPAAAGKPGAAGATAAHSAGPGQTAPAPAAVGSELATAGSELTVAQWDLLISRIAGLPAPSVASKPSSSAIPDPKSPSPKSP